MSRNETVQRRKIFIDYLADSEEIAAEYRGECMKVIKQLGSNSTDNPNNTELSHYFVDGKNVAGIRNLYAPVFVFHVKGSNAG